MSAKPPARRSRRGNAGSAPQLTVIYWRDIPSQVTVQQGRERHSVPLDLRFTRAIDSAAMFAGKTDAGSYMEDWRKETRDCTGDMLKEAEAVAKELEQQFPKDRLRLLIKAKGVAADAEKLSG